MSQLDTHQRHASLQNPAPIPLPGKASFNAGNSRGLKDGADWARHRAAIADLRGLCDPQARAPLANGQFAALLARYALEPRVLAAAAGHAPDQYGAGYTLGFQRGACSVWQWLAEVAEGLEQIP